MNFSLWLFVGLLVFSTHSKAQLLKQLVVDISYDVDYQSRPDEISTNVFKSINAQHITLRSIKDFEDFKKSNMVNGFDEVIFSVSTHGSIEMSPITNHSIILKDGYLDINEIIKIAEDQNLLGKRVALLDFSCHSGADIKRLSKFDPKLFCLITTDSKEQVGYAPFRNYFMKKIGDNTALTLEEIFIESRKNNPSYAAAPFISTDQGLKTLEELSLLEDLISNGLWPVQLRKSLLPLSDCLNDINSDSEYENLSNDVHNVLKHILAEESESKNRYISLIKNLASELSAQTEVSLKNTLNEISNHNDPFFNLNSYILYQRSGITADLEELKKNPNDVVISNRVKSFQELKLKIQKRVGEDNYSELFGVSFHYIDISEIGQLERSLYQKSYNSFAAKKENACSTMKFYSNP